MSQVQSNLRASVPLSLLVVFSTNAGRLPFLIFFLRERQGKQQSSLLFGHSWLATQLVSATNVPDRPWHLLSLIETQRNSSRELKVDGESVIDYMEQEGI